MIGPGKAFDTNLYYVICSNVLGGCRGTTGPGSLHPATGCPYAMSFPVITIGDMVRLQKMLIDSFGIQRLLAVSGGSMGGMQALEWAAAYEWYESPNIHFLTVHDFEALAALESLVVERRYFLAGHRKVEVQPNLMAEVAVFLVRRG